MDYTFDSNFVGVVLIGELERWCGKEVIKNIMFPQIVQQCNRCMGGVNLADMLLSLYRIRCKAKCWHQMIFWHLIDMAKISAWILYCRHFRQNGKLLKDQKSLLQFSIELSDTLILTNKVNPSSSRERSPQNKEVLRQPPRIKSLLKHFPLLMFVLIKSHVGQTILTT